MIIKKLFNFLCCHGVPVSIGSSKYVRSQVLVLKFPFLMTVNGLNWYKVRKAIDFDFLDPRNPLFFGWAKPGFLSLSYR